MRVYSCLRATFVTFAAGVRESDLIPGSYLQVPAREDEYFDPARVHVRLI